MAAVVVDTSVLIDLLRRRPGAIERLAASAAGMNARLATGNPKDFPMRGLVVEHWPSGQ